MSETLLRVADVHAWYGESHVLHGVDFEVRAGEVVRVLALCRESGLRRTTVLA